MSLSYSATSVLSQGMRRPDPIELEYAFLMFLLVLPMGYWGLRLLLALVGI